MYWHTNIHGYMVFHIFSIVMVRCDTGGEGVGGVGLFGCVLHVMRGEGEGVEGGRGNWYWNVCCMIFICNWELGTPGFCNRGGSRWLWLTVQCYVPCSRIMRAMNMEKRQGIFLIGPGWRIRIWRRIMHARHKTLERKFKYLNDSPLTCAMITDFAAA